jgi:hypothetical protein
MYADTDAIRTLGTAASSHAAELANIAATLSALQATSALGPVGARFEAALRNALTDGSRQVAALSERLSAAQTTAHAAAAAYDSVDQGASVRISEG